LSWWRIHLSGRLMMIVWSKHVVAIYIGRGEEELLRWRTHNCFVAEFESFLPNKFP
jgi:hypothetical protein